MSGNGNPNNTQGGNFQFQAGDHVRVARMGAISWTVKSAIVEEGATNDSTGVRVRFEDGTTAEVHRSTVRKIR